MQQFVDGRESITHAVGEVQRKTRALLPLLLAPCIPAVVACTTADMRADAGTTITPEVVARTGLPPLLLRPLSKDDAEALNRRIPFSAGPSIAARAFRAGKDEIAGERALECLTSAIYYEAASESADGQQAVAQVILNRVRHPAFPASVCSVVYQGSTLPTGCQFSFTCDGSLQRQPSRKEWDRARAIAAAALAGSVYAPVGLATHYHADYVVPYWAPSLAKAVQVGAHIFYRWAGDWGRPQGFTQRYAGDERDPVALRNIALLSHQRWPATVLPPQPRLGLTVDPEVELSGIVQLLVSAPTPVGGAYEKLARAYFEPHRAAPLLAALAPAKPAPVETGVAVAAAPASEGKPAAIAPADGAPTPTSPSLPKMLADFARQTKFQFFLRSRQALYKATAKQVEQQAERAATDWETYSGVAIPGGKAVLSLAQGYGTDICPALAPRQASVLRWSADMGPAELFIGSGFARTGLAPAPALSKTKAKLLRAALGPVQEQLVAAVFVRIAALSRGKDVGKAMLLAEVASGHDLVPQLAERLRFFEAHRAEYPTLTDFLPRMVAGLPTIDRGADVVPEIAERTICVQAPSALK